MSEITEDEIMRAHVLNVTGRISAMADTVEEAQKAEQERWDAQSTEIAQLKAKLAGIRSPSKAHLIGGNGWGRSDDHGYGAPKGSYIKAIMDAGSRLAHEQAEGRATLESLTQYQESYGKATLGSTDATGGFIIPNNLVADIVKPGIYENPYFQLATVVEGVRGNVDLTYRGSAPSRAIVVAWGVTKDNADLAYSGYTATMYTLARIYDLAKQFVRQSQGAAEQDVMQELSSAFALGTAHYVREGTGTNEPFGIQTAITAAPFSPTITTSHSPATGTIAGSVSAAIAKAAGALLARNQRPTGVVMSASGYTELLVNGADTAGFYIAGLDPRGAQSPFRQGTLVSPFGLPVYCDPNLAADDMWVANWKALKIYIGEQFRVDTSEEAGERWDKNLVGFRGELDMAVDARPFVYSGALQVVADILA